VAHPPAEPSDFAKCSQAWRRLGASLLSGVGFLLCFPCRVTICVADCICTSCDWLHWHCPGEMLPQYGCGCISGNHNAGGRIGHCSSCIIEHFPVCHPEHCMSHPSEGHGMNCGVVYGRPLLHYFCATICSPIEVLLCYFHKRETNYCEDHR